MKIPAAICMAVTSTCALAGGMSPQRFEDFEVSDGRLTHAEDDHLMISSKEFRATLRAPTKQHVILRFKYLGPTREIAHLQSGEVRHQFGIKLKAQDICNLVYVMWNFDAQQIQVSVKNNPGLQTAEQCKDHGYHFTFDNAVTRKPAPVTVDRWHSLEAKLDEKHLRVLLDNELMWEGDLTNDQMPFMGPVGLRSDNVHVLFDYIVP